MKASLKIISGIGGLVVVSPSSYGIYRIWDINNPTGERRLAESGHTFNKPAFVKHDKPGYSCSENLFSDKNKSIDQAKLYGCAVVKMEKSKDEKFIKFNSEVALRKGDKGWIINTLLENHNRVYSSNYNKHLYKLKFGYVFTEKELGEEKKSESWFFWEGGTSYATTKIHLQIPKKDEEPWYDSNAFIREEKSDDPAHDQTEIFFETTKEWAGIWISDDSTNNPWIFKNLEVWVNQKEYSEVFCKNMSSDNCPASSDASGSRAAYKIENPWQNTWFNNVNAGNSGSGKTQTNISSKIQNMITTIKDLNGNWMDLNDVCGWRWNRNIDNYQLDKLKIYCSK